MNEGLKQHINELKSAIDLLRPLDKDTEGRIQQKFRLDWNFHSNNIEGNSLTFGETKTFLLHGITADGKPLKDHLDIKGHNQALEMLEDIVHDGRDLSENFIREMHQIILHEPYDKAAITPDGIRVKRHIQVGSYKMQPNHVVTETNETFYFAKPEETPAMMNDLMVWYNNAISERKLHPIELAALLHYKFIRIHPFDDGNGRLSRILMNLSLMKFGFPPVIIKTQKKEEYYRALQQADGGDTTFFVDYIARLQIDSLELYLRGAKGEHIEDVDDVKKELMMLKQSINGSRFNYKRDIDSQSRAIKNSITSLINQFCTYSKIIEDLFSRTSFMIGANVLSNSQPQVHSRSIDEIIDILHNMKSIDLQYIDFRINYNEYLGNLNNRFDLTVGFHVRFGNYKYLLNSNNQNIIQKGYDEELSHEELTHLTDNEFKRAIEIIKNNS